MLRLLLPLTLLPLLAGCTTEAAPPPALETPRTAAAEPAAAAETAAKSPAADAALESPRRHALLIGCTKYDNLDARTALVGPGNDVILFRDLLVNHFQFKDATIVILAENQGGPTTRPTYANIKREFQNLARHAQSGDEVVILLGGHGFYLPDVNPNEDDPEPDGLDECFLPCDTQKFTASSNTIGNAIRDDEINDWLTAIRDQGTFVWYIADTCHSGSGSRALPDETPPEVSREPHFSALGLSSEDVNAWREAQAEDPLEKPSAPRSAVPHEKPGQGKWVAIYGAQSYQTAPEMLLPKQSDGEHQKMHGLLTFSICQLLTKSEEPLTYGELVQKLVQEYASMGRQGPDPLVEGPGTDQEVMGKHEWPGRTRLRVIEKDGRLLVTGGTMVGLTNGTILAIHNTIERKPDQEPVGYVKLTECSAVESFAVACDRDGNAVERRAPPTGYAQVVRLDYSYFPPLTIGIDPLDTKVAAGDLRRDIQSQLGTRNGPNALLEVKEGLERADWVVRSHDGKAYLVPPTGWQVSRSLLDADNGIAVPGPEYGPFALDDPDQVKRLADNIQTIARAQNLLRLAPASDGSRLISGNVNILMEMKRHADLQDETGTPFDPSQGVPIVQPGELIGFQLTNKGRTKVDVTLLMVDAAYGITAWYPKPDRVGDNRIDAGTTIGPKTIGRAKINANTTGLEHMLLIAVEVKGTAIDFTWLAQAGIKRRALGHPLDALLDHATSREGTRGADAADQPKGTAYVMRTVSWRVPSEAQQ